MKKTFTHIYPKGIPHGFNDIKITFFSLMPDLFVKDNYVISVNYDKTSSPTHGSFDTEVLIMILMRNEHCMKQRDDGTFGFNSWRVELNESKMMEMYQSQEIDLIESIEQYGK